MDVSPLVFLAPIAALISLGFAAIMAMQVLKVDEGTDRMKEISTEIRMGAMAYLMRQYKTVGVFFAGLFVVLIVLVFLGWLPVFTPFAFISGGFFSALSGFIGMNIATRANTRTAAACRSNLDGGLRVAFRSGAVMGFVVVGLGMLDLSFWYFLLNWFYRELPQAQRVAYIASAMVTFGIGASIMNLFARVGGGVYTKAADVGADLVGKVEANIPEDDPRNPAVIADNVGDNVGDVAGMGADLYESYVVSILSAVALAAAAGFANPVNGMAVPLSIAAVGIFCSIIGTFIVRAKEGATQAELLKTLHNGVYVSSVLIAIAAFFIVNFLIPGHVGVFFAILAGLIAGNLIGFTTEYYTSGAYKPTQELAKSSSTGAATIIINGLSLGMLSTAAPVIIVAIAVMFSFFVTGGGDNLSMGLFGVAVASVGMLSTLGITLATDAYGPIADNAGGIAEMSELPPEVRVRTDALDSLGNTTAATGKGFAIGSAALTCLALIAAFREEVMKITGAADFALDLLNPSVLIGMFLGGAVVFVFSSMTMKAVARAAEGIVVEVRRQFREIPGLLEGKPGAKPDSKRCVDICTQSALKELVMPTVIVVLAPVVVGFFLGANGVAGMLGGATVTGFLMALMMSNAGGAWDNAKKYIEAGNEGGKGSDNHKAAVVGDTVGDPFKDTSGPSLNTVIKLLSVVAIVFATFVLNISQVFPWN